MTTKEIIENIQVVTESRVDGYDWYSTDLDTKVDVLIYMLSDIALTLRDLKKEIANEKDI